MSMTKLNQNTTDLQSLLESINELPDAGVTLPTLTNPGSAADLLSGKQLINQDGEAVTGTIPTKTASSLTASGATVTVPAGYYASQATKSVATATQATPSVSIDANGLITASATQSAGYVAAGTKSGTKQLTTQAAKTITPSKSSQTAVAKNVYTTGAVTVDPIPSQYQDVSGVTAAAADVLTGKKIVTSSGTVTTGTMPNNGAVSETLDLDSTSYTPAKGYHSGSGKVQVDSSINTTVDTQADLIAQIKSEHETQIAAIKTALEGKAAGSGGGSGGASVETCTVTVSVSENGLGSQTVDVEFTAVEEDGSISLHSVVLEAEGNKTQTYTVVKNTLFILYQEGGSYDYEVSGEVYDYIENVFEVNGDGSISITF